MLMIYSLTPSDTNLDTILMSTSNFGVYSSQDQSKIGWQEKNINHSISGYSFVIAYNVLPLPEG